MKIKKILATISATAIMLSTIYVPVAYADAVPIVTIGADLTEEQKDTVLSFFGVSENSVDVIEINNSQEREYLEGLIPSEVIGTRTLSCSYILPTTSGGIVVKTANLNWVSDGMLANALLTAGIMNCQVLATAPFEVSGTGALTGVMTAYEKSSGEVLEEDKKALATEELIVTGEIIDEVVNNTNSPEGVQEITEAQILSLLNDIKSEVINGKLTEDKIKEIVQKNLDEYKVSITEDTYNKLVNYLTSLSQKDYFKGFKDSLSSLTDRINKGFDINVNLNIDIDFKTDKNSIEQFWINIWNWIKYIFGGAVDDVKDSINIFDKVNTDIIQYDEPVDDEQTTTNDNIEQSNNIVDDSGEDITNLESTDDESITNFESTDDESITNFESTDDEVINNAEEVSSW